MKLEALFGLAPKSFNTEFGKYRPPAVAVIDEATCIGCAGCLPPCATDALIGANKWMHTVVLGLCTGCELCRPVCQVDCIRIEPIAALPDARMSRQRINHHQFPLARDQGEYQAKPEAAEAQALARLLRDTP